jgi:hypothetical protein
MRRQIFPLTPHTWSQTLQRTRFVVVRVTSGTGTVPQGLVDLVEAGLDERITWAHVDRNLRHPPSFWSQAFQSPLGPLKRDGAAPDEGFYLFVDGVAKGHHAGGSLKYEASVEPIAIYLRQKMVLATTDTGTWATDDPPPRETGGSRGPEPGGSRGRETGGPRTDMPTPPPPRVADPDPYEVLGVASTCTDDELRSAYKQALKLNHPDRVAHLSPALQAFALAQTQAIRLAWDTLEKKRNLK